MSLINIVEHLFMCLWPSVFLIYKKVCSDLCSIVICFVWVFFFFFLILSCMSCKQTIYTLNHSFSLNPLICIQICYGITQHEILNETKKYKQIIWIPFISNGFPFIPSLIQVEGRAF